MFLRRYTLSYLHPAFILCVNWKQYHTAYMTMLLVIYTLTRITDRFYLLTGGKFMFKR